MSLSVERTWRLEVVLLTLALASTSAFAVGNAQMSGSNCCGNADMGGCTLNYPYQACADHTECPNPCFPNCCNTGGFC